MNNHVINHLKLTVLSYDCHKHTIHHRINNCFISITVQIQYNTILKKLLTLRYMHMFQKSECRFKKQTQCRFRLPKTHTHKQTKPNILTCIGVNSHLTLMVYTQNFVWFSFTFADTYNLSWLYACVCVCECLCSSTESSVCSCAGIECKPFCKEQLLTRHFWTMWYQLIHVFKLKKLQR